MKKYSKLYIIFILFLIQGIVSNTGHPVTPKFVTDLGIESYMFGVFFAAMSAGLMVGGILWGHFAETINKKYLIITGLIIYGTGQLLFGMVTNEYLMVLIRFISGLGSSASFTLMTAQIIESSSVEQRAKNLGFAAATTTLGSSLGYYIGGQLGSNQYLTNLFNIHTLGKVFMIQGMMVYILVILIYFTYHFPFEKQPNHKPTMLSSLKYITKLKPQLIIFLISLMLFSTGRINVEKYLDVYFNDIGYLTSDLGTFVMITGFVSLFASILIVPLFNKVKKLIPVFIILQILSAIIIYIVFRSNDFIFSVYTFYMLFVFIRTIYQPLEQKYIADQISDGRYSLVMGIRQSFFSLGLIIGPLFGGVIYQYSKVLLFDSSSILFMISTILLVIIMLKNVKK